jgi:fucose 4-O-acetylase-like acetyltransferase
LLRDPALDNIKLAMILLVVLGHLIEPMINYNEHMKTIYMFIYSFHMPIFIIISGALTKPYSSETHTKKKLVIFVTIMLMFTFLYEILNLIMLKSISNYTLNFQPYWILWFIFSVFIWKASLPIIIKLKFPVLITTAISLLIGYDSHIDNFLGLNRTIYFFPFFIIGYKLGPSLLLNKFLVNIHKFYYLLLLTLIIVVFWLLKDLPHQWLYGNSSYNKLGFSEWYSFIVRLLLYLISLLACTAVIMLIPRKESKLTKRGRNTIFVYLWHGFIVKIVIYLGAIHFLNDSSNYIALIYLFSASVLITFFLSSLLIKNITQRFLILPVQKLLLIKV